MPWRQFGRYHLDDATIQRIVNREQGSVSVYSTEGMVYTSDAESCQAFLAWAAEREAEGQQTRESQDIRRAQDAYAKATYNRWEKEVLRGMGMLEDMAWTDWTTGGLQQRNFRIIQKVCETLERATIAAINDRTKWTVAAARILEAIS